MTFWLSSKICEGGKHAATMVSAQQWAVTAAANIAHSLDHSSSRGLAHGARYVAELMVTKAYWRNMEKLIYYDIIGGE